MALAGHGLAWVTSNQNLPTARVSKNDYGNVLYEQKFTSHCNPKTFKHCFRRYCVTISWWVALSDLQQKKKSIKFSCSLLSFVFPVLEHISLPDDRLAANLNNLCRNSAVMVGSE